MHKPRHDPGEQRIERQAETLDDEEFQMLPAAGVAGAVSAKAPRAVQEEADDDRDQKAGGTASTALSCGRTQEVSGR